MTKLCSFIAVILVLSMLLSGCKNTGSTTASNTDTDVGTAPTDISSTDGETENIYGTWTDGYYINKWLGLFLDLSSGTLTAPMTQGSIYAYQASSGCVGRNAVVDVCAYQPYHYAVWVFISDMKGKTIQECYNRTLSAEQEIHKGNPSLVYEKVDSYEFLDEQYMQLHITADSATTSINGESYRTAPVNCWYLLRLKDDKLITIKCVSELNSNKTLDTTPLSTILGHFKKAKDMAGYPTVKRPNFTDEQVMNLIANVLSEEAADIGYSRTYGQAIDRIFKEYEWSFEPIIGYDYLYIAKFTGKYYSHPSSYYQLNEDYFGTMNGTISLLVDIRNAYEIKLPPNNGYAGFKQYGDRVAVYSDPNHIYECLLIVSSVS